MNKTSIEWCDFSINPIRAKGSDGNVGHHCEKVSPGCQNCYASRLQSRFKLSEFSGPSRRERVDCFLDESKLRQVLTRKKPSRIFWCDMTDLFGEWVRDEWIDKCFAVMALTPQHTHQVLTKRPWNALRYMRTDDKRGRAIWLAAREMTHHEAVPAHPCGRHELKNAPYPPWLFDASGDSMPWPLPNVWLGVSVENQQYADERIPILLRTPAAVRFLSCEPLLGPLGLIDHLTGNSTGHETGGVQGWQTGPAVDWVIVGGESGPNARPMHPDWARGIRDQCQAAGVPFFMKQMSKKGPIPADLFYQGVS